MLKTILCSTAHYNKQRLTQHEKLLSNPPYIQKNIVALSFGDQECLMGNKSSRWYMFAVTHLCIQYTTIRTP